MSPFGGGAGEVIPLRSGPGEVCLPPEGFGGGVVKTGMIVFKIDRIQSLDYGAVVMIALYAAIQQDIVVPDAVVPVAWTFRSGNRQGRSPALRYWFPLNVCPPLEGVRGRRVKTGMIVFKIDRIQSLGYGIVVMIALYAAMQQDIVVPDAVVPVAWTFRSGYRQGRSPAQRYGFPLKDDDGATSFQTWKLSFGCACPVFCLMLQWGHVFSDVEIKKMLYNQLKDGTGFNGATSFQTWKLRQAVPSACPTRASMGPRLFRRGNNEQYALRIPTVTLQWGHVFSDVEIAGDEPKYLR